MDAAEAIGWDAKLCDGKSNEGGAWGLCVRQALAAGADGILTRAIDCAAIKQPLLEAAAADVPVVNFGGFDCDQDPGAEAEEPLFAASVLPASEFPSNVEYQQAMGAARAAWVAARSEGQAKVLSINFAGPSIGAYLNEGFESEMAACEDCELQTVDVALQDFGNLRQMLESEFQRNPDTTYVAVPLDGLVLLGASQATVAWNRQGHDVQLIGGEGLAPNLDLIRSNQGQDAAVATPVAWWGWAGVDTLNRVFAGEESQPSGLGFQLIDREHNLPETGSYESDVDFQAGYTAAWGQ